MRTSKTRHPLSRCLALLTSLCLVFTMSGPISAFASSQVPVDGVADNWAQDPATVKGTDAVCAVEDGWLHVASGTQNGNNPSPTIPPAVFVNSSYAVDFTKAGYFEATLKSPQAGAKNRFGIYLGYKDQNTGLFLGYNSTGWYTQAYGAPDDPWSDGKLPVPGANAQTKMRIDWTAEGKAALTVDGKVLFENVDFSGIAGLGNRIAIKGGTYGAERTDVYLKDIHYTGQATQTVYDVSGVVTDEKNAPLAGVAVKENNETVATTGADGAYRVAGLKPGAHTFQFTMDGYQAQEKTVTITDQDISTNADVQMVPVNVPTYTLSTAQMDVTLDQNFPRVIKYDMKGDLQGKVMQGQSTVLDSMKVNGETVKPAVTSKKSGNDKAVYTMAVKDDAKHIDAVLTAQITVKDNSLSFDITKVENKLDNAKYPVSILEIPNQNLVSVNSTQAGAALRGATMSNNTRISGDEQFTIDKNLNVKLNGHNDFMYAFLSNNELSAGLDSNSTHDGYAKAAYAGGGAYNTRVIASAEDKGAYKTVGLSSALWYFDRLVTDSHGTTRLVTHTENEMPHAQVAIAGDQNQDSQVDWQDGAIAFRSIMHNPAKSEEVPELVAWRIAMNFSSQAQNPFLLTLDNVKKVAQHTDGLGQSILLKGYASEGHDSGHPDYGNIGARIGGAADMNTMMEGGAALGARFGIHINASEMYPEASAFSDNLVRRDSNGNLRYGWNWLDQGVGIDALYDLSSGERDARFADLKSKVGDNMDFIYLDVWGNGTSGAEDSWQTRKVSEQINNNGWRMSNEWSAANEYDATFQHWAADLTYGGYQAKGLNSAVMRFLRNQQKDSWVADYPSYGGAANAPLLGGYSMKDFEGWQGRSDYDAYINNLYSHDVSTKFLQHFKVTKWVDGDAVTLPTGETWVPEMEVTLQDGAGNTVVASRGSNTYSTDTLSDYRDRTITMNGKVVLKGHVSKGDWTAAGDESYLLPWNWDSTTGKFVASENEKLYHWNTAGGESTWELPDNWKDLKTVKYYELTANGKTNAQEIPVAAGKVTLNAKAETPYVVCKGSEGNLDIDWSVGTHMTDTGFNAGNLDAWNPVGDASISNNQSSNPMLKLGAGGRVTQELTGLKPGTQYALYVGVDNRSNAKVNMAVSEGGKVLAQNGTGASIAPNYSKADPHSTNQATVQGGGSKFQNMYVFFTPSGDKATLDVRREAGSGYTYLDDFRAVENAAENLVQVDENGSVTRFEQDFENNAQGLYPFVVGPIEGVEDNRTHLSELHAPYTQAGWDVKKLDDVIEGRWSLKSNGLAQRNALVYQTVPQNFRFEPGVTYQVSFDYEAGSNNTYAVTYGSGQFAGNTPLLPLAKTMTGSPTTEENKNYQRFSFTMTGAENGQSWFGIYSTGTAPDTQGTSGNAANFGGYLDLILDNLVIEKSDVQLSALASAVDAANAKAEQDYTAETWAPFAQALAAAQAVLDKGDATQEEVDSAAKALNGALDALVAIQGTVSGTVTADGKPVANAAVTLTADGLPTQTATTDADGQYAFADIFVRDYNVRVTADGYETIYSETVTPEAGKTVTKDLQMTAQAPAQYENRFVNGDVASIKDLAGNDRKVAIQAGKQDNGNSLQLGFPGGHANAVDTAAPQFKNGVVEADVTAAGNGNRFGFTLRGVDMNQRLYVGVGDSPNTYFWEFWNGASNSWSGMYSGPAMTAGTTRHMKAELNDSTLKLWVDGQVVFEETLPGAAPAEAGYVGFECRNSAQFTVDNLRVTSYDEPSAAGQAVSGQVQSGGQAVVGAQATLTGKDGGAPVFRVVSGVDGAYAFAGVPAGSYTLAVAASGYETVTKDVTVADAAVTLDPIELTKVQVELSITGLVTDAHNYPVENAKVELLPKGQDTALMAANTQPDGTYAFRNVADGVYTLRVTAKGYGTATQEVTVQGASVEADAIVLQTQTVTAVITLQDGTQHTATGPDDVIEIPQSSSFRVDFTSNGKVDTFDFNAGNGAAISTGTIAKWNGTKGAYTLYALGAPDSANGQTGIYVNGKRLFQMKTVKRPLVSDTTMNFAKRVGDTYTFWVQPDDRNEPFTFLTANGDALQTSVVKGMYPTSDNRYYCQVKVAKAAGPVGVYCKIGDSTYKLFVVDCRR